MNEQEETKIITRKEAREMGLKRYFTEEACRNGHIAERVTGSGRCLKCLDGIKKRRRDAYSIKTLNTDFREKENARSKEYRENNRDRRAATIRKYYYKNHEKIKKKNREWASRFFQKHPEIRRAINLKHSKTLSATRIRLKGMLGYDPPEDFVKSWHTNLEIKRFIKQQKQNQ